MAGRGTDHGAGRGAERRHRLGDVRDLGRKPRRVARRPSEPDQLEKRPGDAPRRMGRSHRAVRPTDPEAGRSRILRKKPKKETTEHTEYTEKRRKKSMVFFRVFRVFRGPFF